MKNIKKYKMAEAVEISPWCTYIQGLILSKKIFFFYPSRDCQKIGPRRTDAYKTKSQTLDRTRYTLSEIFWYIYISVLERICSKSYHLQRNNFDTNIVDELRKLNLQYRKKIQHNGYIYTYKFSKTVIPTKDYIMCLEQNIWLHLRKC